MKTIIAFLAATVVVAGATSVVANEVQASDEAANYALSHAAGSSFGGAYNSARAPAGARNMSAPSRTDVQAGGSW